MKKSLLLVTTIALSACSVIQPRPVIERRFASYVSGTDVGNPPLTLRVSSADPDEQAPKAKKEVKLSDLSDRGQAALITATSGKPPYSIKAEDANKAGSDGIISLTQMSRTVVFAPVALGFMTPGDRVDAMRISLQVDPNLSGDWKIVGWDFVANKYESHEIASVSDEASSTLTASTGLGLGPLLPEANVGGEISRSSKSDYKVLDYSSLDAMVMPDGTAWVLQSASSGRDLAHNASVQVGLQYFGSVKILTYNAFSKLYDEPEEGETAKPLAPDKVSLSVVRVEAPSDENAVCGQVKMAYRVRGIHKDKGRSTVTEYDDTAELTVFDESIPTNRVSFFLAPPPQARFFHIFVGNAPVQFKSNRFSQPQDLAFASLDEAIAFVTWLQAIDFSGTDLREGQIGFAGASPDLQPIGKAKLSQLGAGILMSNRELNNATEARCSAPPKAAPTQDAPPSG